MTQHRLVSVKLPAALIAAIERAAHAADTPPAELIRGALIAAFSAQNEGHDLRAVHEALLSAEGWLELQTLLRRAGFVLRARGPDLMLHSWPIEAEILPLDALGASQAALTLRYRADFPGMVRGNRVGVRAA